MREILFRGKTVGGEWVYGDLLHDGFDYDVAIWEIETKLVTEVIPETVGQFTGLTDKNGKKIFEGDIVKDFIPFNFTIGGKKEFEENVYVVEYCVQKCGFKPFCETDYYGQPIIEECKVIGNIHDNPELLEKYGLEYSDDEDY